MCDETQDAGFSIVELLTVVSILAITGTIAIPIGIRQVGAYKAQADATSVASMLNVARMKAASQFAPYSLDINVSGGTFVLEQLCGTNATDSACTGTGATPYTSFSTPAYDTSGTQYLTRGNSFAICRPSGVTAFPGAITADPSPCSGDLQVFFNTRGSPVKSNGNPLDSGGLAVYLQNSGGMVNAVVVSLGGHVSVWTYSPASSKWSLR